MRQAFAFALILLCVLSAGTYASEADSAPTVQTLELLSKFEIPAAPMPASTARDIRWASDSTLYLAFGSAGVGEFEIGEELTLKKEIFAPRNREGAKTIKNLWNLAVSKDHIVGFSATGDIVRRKTSSESEMQLASLQGFLEAMDVDGDKIFLLGQPGWPKFKESGWSFLWTATIGSGLTDWKAIGDLQLATSEDARPLMNRALGSLRLLSNGDILVVPVVKPGVFLYSSSGKMTNSWTQSELESSLVGALGLAATEGVLPEEGRFSGSDIAVDAEQINGELQKRRLIVEDVVPIGKKPGIVVRYRSPDHTGFYLAVLSSETTWYKLPMKAHPATVRVRSDALPRKGKLALLVSDRGKPSDGTDGRIYIVNMP